MFTFILAYDLICVFYSKQVSHQITYLLEEVCVSTFERIMDDEDDLNQC